MILPDNAVKAIDWLISISPRISIEQKQKKGSAAAATCSNSEKPLIDEELSALPAHRGDSHSISAHGFRMNTREFDTRQNVQVVTQVWLFEGTTQWSAILNVLE